VVFPTQIGAPVGIVANAGNTQFTVTDTGTYLVTVYLPPLGAGGPWALEVGGSQVGATLPLTSSSVVNVSAGTAIAVQSTGSNGGPSGGAEITIVRIA
jgi:hypothetical protein